MSVFIEDSFQKVERYRFFPSKEAIQHLYVPLEIGHGFFKEGDSFSPTAPTGYFFVYALKGSFFLDMPSGKGQIPSNTFVFTDATQKQTYYASAANVEYVLLHFDGVDAEHLFLQSQKASDFAIASKNPKAVKKILKQLLLSGKEQKETSETALSLKIYELLCTTLEPTLQGNYSKSTLTENYEECILFAENYIQENLESPLTVKEIAKVVHMSTSHFSRVFKEQTGFSPYDYVLNARLQKAKKYLAKDEKSIEQIAFLTGFNSTSNFIYCFTGNVGMSPLKYRKQNQ